MIAVVINPIAGGSRAGTARERVERASKALEACGERTEIFVTDRRGHARELTEAAVRLGARLVVAWGGDGTVNEVASALAFGPAALGFVRSGSGNGLARELGVSRQPDQALLEAVAAKPRTIDAGEIDGRLFFNIAGIGFDAHVAACLARDATSRRGLRAYVQIAARESLAYRTSTYRINDDPRPRRAVLVTLANSSQFGNGARIAPMARLDDGRLDLVVVEETSRLQTFYRVPILFTGGVARLNGVTMHPVEQVTITSDQPMPFHIDGEPILGGVELSARVRPGALRVCVR